MKNFLIFSILSVFFLNNFTNLESVENKKIKLQSKSIKSFYDYISSDRKPSDRFLITIDGTGSFTWFCPQRLCLSSSEKVYVKPCSEIHNQPCKIFAVGRKIKWKNLDNTKTTIIKFKQSDKLSDVKRKLKKFNFIN